MGKLYTLGSPITNTYSVSKNAPLDDRLTVRYIADLTDGEEGGIAALVYKGMVVYVQEDNSLYVYIGASNATWKNKKTGAPMNGGLASNWVKIDSFVDPESFLEYYQEKLGAKILDSTDEFSTIENPFDGQFAYVRDGSEASEDESGLYIYDGGLWVRILTGSGEVSGDYVKREELEDYLKKEVLDDLAKKSDLDGYIKREDLADFLTASDLDDYLKVSELPTNVSDFINDAGYITSTNLRIPAEWNISGSMRDLIDDINDDVTATPGKVYLGTIHLNDLPYSEDESWSGRRLIQGEARIEIMASQGDTGKVINFTLTSTLKPYHWEYTSSWRNEGEWISFLTEHQDISGKADKSDIPTKVSELTNDEGYLKGEDLPDFLTDSDLDIYAKKSDLDDYLKVEELPTNVSDFINDAGYLKSEDLPDFLLASDLEDYVKIEELENYIPKSELEKLAKKSDLDGYVKTADALEFLTAADLEGYAKTEDIPTKVSELANDEGYLKTADLPDFLLASDLEDYVKVEDLENYIPKSELEELARKSDLDGYVKTEDALEFLTASDLDDYLKVSELPTNVSEFINDAGYLKVEDLPDFLLASDLDDYVKVEDLEDYIPKSELEKLATKSDLDGYVKTADAIYFLTGEDLVDYATKDYVDSAVSESSASILTPDGSAPASGTGFSILADDPDGLVEEIYADNGLESGKFYTSRGLNSSDKNGGSDLDVEYITLTNGGTSSIKLNSADDDNWIELNVTDDSLGFSREDVTWVDAEGNEHQMTENPLILPKGSSISFGDKDVDFNGMTETRNDDPTEYIFGDTGSSYNDVDIYTSEPVPTVYAYGDGNQTRLLTDADKDELIDKIDNSSPESISTEEILGLF